MLAHALAGLTSAVSIKKVFVVLAPNDTHWASHDWTAFENKLLVLRCGGTSRAASVTNALAAIEAQLAPDDWVLVHDAARPCLDARLVERLIATLADDPVGGLLAVPVADTLKRANDSAQVAETVSRAALWQAQTPQMFRYALLRHALITTALLSDITDESSAVEALGHHPKLVQGDVRNLKVTYPADSALAEILLKADQT